MKKIVLIIPTVIVIGIITTIIIFGYYKNNNITNNEVKEKTKLKKKNKTCIPFTGGSFNLIFNVNEGNKIETMNICIACSPDSYKDIPTPTKEGYTFDGWYYDKELTKKVEIINTKDIKPIPEYNNKKCMTGYKDIEIFAKWNEVPITQSRELVAVNNNSNNNNNNNTNIPVKDNTPVNNSQKIYKPTNTGTVISGFGYSYNQFHGMKVSVPYGIKLYPINDGEYVTQYNYGTSNGYKYGYFIYKTRIDNIEYYVMYRTTNGIIQFSKTENEYNNTYRKLKYNEPIGILLNTKYDIYITMVFSNNISSIVKGITTFNTEYQINSNKFLNLNVGDTFNER